MLKPNEWDTFSGYSGICAPQVAILGHQFHLLFLVDMTTICFLFRILTPQNMSFHTKQLSNSVPHTGRLTTSFDLTLTILGLHRPHRLRAESYKSARRLQQTLISSCGSQVTHTSELAINRGSYKPLLRSEFAVTAHRTQGNTLLTSTNLL